MVMYFLVVTAWALPHLAGQCGNRNEKQCAQVLNCAWDDTVGTCTKSAKSTKSAKGAKQCARLEEQPCTQSPVCRWNDGKCKAARLALEFCESDQVAGKFGKSRFCCKKHNLRCDSCKKFCESDQKGDKHGVNKFCCRKHNLRCDLEEATKEKCANHSTTEDCAYEEGCAWHKDSKCKPDGGLSTTRRFTRDSLLTSEEIDDIERNISDSIGSEPEDTTVTLVDDAENQSGYQYDVHFEDVTESQKDRISASADISNVAEESEGNMVWVLVVFGVVACALMVCLGIWCVKKSKSRTNQIL